MTSQLNVDTIVDKAGSGGTNVKIGNTSTYVSDGGATTQNTVQGLAKHWVNYNNNGTTNDSLNTASVTDVGTGNHLPAMTNAMANSNYCISGTLIGSNGNVGYLDSHQTSGSRGTSSYEVGTNDVNNSDQDHTMNQTTVDGDLA